MKCKDLQPNLPSKLLFRIKREIKSFPDKKNLKKLIPTKPLLQEMLVDLFKKKKKE